MEGFLVFSSLLVLVTAQYPNPSYEYGSPSAPQYGAPAYPQYGAPVSPGIPQGYSGSQPQGPSYLPQPQLQEEEDTRPVKVVKHVWIHTAEDDESSGITRIIKAPIERERQVNIIFVKAPAPAPADQQIVDIPADGGRKNIVYVLLKKADATPDVGFKTPAPTQPSKPEVYFIRYKDGQKPPSVAAGPEYGSPSAPSSPPHSGYGAPPAPVARSQAPAPRVQPAPSGYSSPPNAQLGGYQKK